jgi:hypothetical protein
MTFICFPVVHTAQSEGLLGASHPEEERGGTPSSGLLDRNSSGRQEDARRHQDYWTGTAQVGRRMHAVIRTIGQEQLREAGGCTPSSGLLDRNSSGREEGVRRHQDYWTGTAQVGRRGCAVIRTTGQEQPR